MFTLKQIASRLSVRTSIRTISLTSKYNYASANESPKDTYYKSNQRFIRDVTNFDASYSDVKFFEPSIRKVLEYNDVSKVESTGILLNAYKKLEKPENITDRNLDLVYKLTHCMDFLIYYILVADDIVDNSEVRVNAPCWYKLPDVGVGGAIYDSMLIRDMVFRALKLYFKDHSHYLEIVDSFNEAALRLSIGVKLELEHKKSESINFDLFTSEYYALQCKYKTSYLVYLLPIRLCLLMCGRTDPLIHEAIQDASFKLGIYVQAQDDYLDQDPKKNPTGKVGNDIEEGKNSWPAVAAVENCNKQQFEIMKKYYGRKDSEHVQRIIDLYKDLNMDKLYTDYEEAMYKAICKDIKKLPNDLHEMFYGLVHKLYKGRNQIY